MNIAIVGCGNVGFETARLLCRDHNLLLINRRLPADVASFVHEHGNVSFARADATDPLSFEQALTGLGAKANHIDVLLSSVGAFCSTSALEDFQTFARDFQVNFFGNLVPIQAILKRMMLAHSGRIVVLSSTSGVFTYPGLTAYAPAKWALTAFCRTLRNEVRRHGIGVDMVFPASIRNRRSRTFLYQDGIEVERVATRIGRLLKAGAGADHFIPRRYSLLRPLEQMFPQMLDRRAGLQRDRRRRFRRQRVRSALLFGAPSGLGRQLAGLYAKIVQRLYLVGLDWRAWSEWKTRREPSSAGTTEVIDCTMADGPFWQRVASQVQNVDLFLCVPESGAARQIADVSPSGDTSSLTASLLAPVRLAVELLRRHRISGKIIMVLSTAPLEGRPGWSCDAALQAALWSFTRGLRRTRGNDLQVMEVLVQEAGRAWTDGIVARQILDAERAGRERVVLPPKAAWSMYVGALAPRLHQRLLRGVEGNIGR